MNIVVPTRQILHMLDKPTAPRTDRARVLAVGKPNMVAFRGRGRGRGNARATSTGRRSGGRRTATSATDLAMCLDPVVMLQALGLQADPWQTRLLRSDAGQILVNIHRQGGKSTTVGVLATHTAMYQPGSLVLLLSPGLRQSQELFQKCLGAYHAAGSVVPADAENRLTLELANGSRIISLPGTEATIRGYSAVSLVVLDEAARVPDELYLAIRPMLAVSGGRLVALSTPFGTRGWWYEAWRSEEEWERYEVKAEDCPRISSHFLENERQSMGSFWFDQEYMCAFASGQTQAFTQEDVERALEEEITSWQL